MTKRKSWAEFRETGLLFLINIVLHTFGWAIIVEVNVENEKEVVNCYPARVNYRGFPEKISQECYLNIARYMRENAEEIYQEAI